jgi:hypothetical protein
MRVLGVSSQARLYMTIVNSKVGEIVTIWCEGATWNGLGFMTQCRVLTRQTTLPTSSATSNAPDLSSTTPTGRPKALPSPLRKPVSTSTGSPVVVDRTSRQIHDFAGARADARVASGVRETYDRFGIGDVEIVADQRHPNRRVQPVHQHRANINHAVTIAVTQQGDAVGAGYASVRADVNLVQIRRLESGALTGT